jgi:hypothetical protein
MYGHVSTTASKTIQLWIRVHRQHSILWFLASCFYFSKVFFIQDNIWQYDLSGWNNACDIKGKDQLLENRFYIIFCDQRAKPLTAVVVLKVITQYHFNVNSPSVLVKATKLDRCSVNEYQIDNQMLISAFRPNGNNIYDDLSYKINSKCTSATRIYWFSK